MKAFFKILLMLIPIGAISQTTFYLNLNTACPLPTALSANWNVTSGNVKLMTWPQKDGSTITSTQSGNTGAAAVRKILIKTFYTQPLATQNILTNSTITAQIRGNMSSVSSRTGQGWVYIRLINPDGTVASEIGNFSTTGYTTTLTNRTYSLTLAGNVGITCGQRICFEIGWNYQTGSNTATNATNSFGSSSATDLTVDNTATGANNPWIKFSQTIGFQNAYRFM